MVAASIWCTQVLAAELTIVPSAAQAAVELMVNVSDGLTVPDTLTASLMANAAVPVSTALVAQSVLLNVLTAA